MTGRVATSALMNVPKKPAGDKKGFNREGRGGKDLLVRDYALEGRDFRRLELKV